MDSLLIKNAKIINEGNIFVGDILIEGEIISSISNKINIDSGTCLLYTSDAADDIQ